MNVAYEDQRGEDSDLENGTYVCNRDSVLKRHISKLGIGGSNVDIDGHLVEGRGSEIREKIRTSFLTPLIINKIK